MCLKTQREEDEVQQRQPVKKQINRKERKEQFSVDLIKEKLIFVQNLKGSMCKI